MLQQLVQSNAARPNSCVSPNSAVVGRLQLVVQSASRLWPFKVRRLPPLCGRQSCLQAAFQAASKRPFTHFVFSTASCLPGIVQRRPRNLSRIGDGGLKARLSALALLWGSQSWLQPAFSRLARPLTNFPGFPSRYLQDPKPKKRCDRQCSGFASRLKGGCRHDCLPHWAPRTAKAERRPERPPASTIACHTKSQRPVGGFQFTPRVSRCLESGLKPGHSTNVFAYNERGGFRCARSV
jgi:hypothetical protein